jgi:hypothetical protein
MSTPSPPHNLVSIKGFSYRISDKCISPERRRLPPRVGRGEGGALLQLQKTAQNIRPDLDQPPISRKRKPLADAPEDLAENKMAPMAPKKRRSHKKVSYAKWDSYFSRLISTFRRTIPK